MTSRDWDFAIGDLGDPIADIEHWMTPPYPDNYQQFDREKVEDVVCPEID